MKTDTIQTRNRITTCLMALLTCCLVLTGIFFIAPIKAEAAVGGTFTDGGITYKILSEEAGNYTVEVNTYRYLGGQESNLVIPSTASNGTTTYTVVGIAGEAIYVYSAATLTIPSTVTSIENDAFWYAPELKAVYVDDENPNYADDNGDLYNKDFTTLLKYAPKDGETTVTFKATVTKIGAYAFYNNTGLKSVEIPQGIVEIGDYAFYNNTGLESVEIPEGVTKIGQSAFVNCNSLTAIEIPGTVSEIENETFFSCSALSSVTISEGVVKIGKYAFSDCKFLETVSMPTSLTTIDNRAFYGCTSLTEVNIPQGVMSIDSAAFDGCTLLTNISVNANNATYSSVDGNLYSKDGTTFILYAPGKTETEFEVPQGVTSIGSYAFRDNDYLERISLPNGVTSLEYGAFMSCDALEDVNLPNSVTSIGDYAFYGCALLANVTIPNGVTSIGDYAFAGCDSLTAVEVPDSVTSIGNHAFASCDSLVSITLPQEVTELGNYVFNYCKALEHVTIPEGVKLVYGMFEECTSLKSVVLPSSTTAISSSTFETCTALESVVFQNADCTFYNNVEFSANVTVYAPPGGTVEEFCTDNGVTFDALFPVTWDLMGGTAEVAVPNGWYNEGSTIVITPEQLEGLQHTFNFTLAGITVTPLADGAQSTEYPFDADSAEAIELTVPAEGLSITVNWQGETITVGNLKYRLLTAYGETYTVTVVGAYYATTPANGSVDLVIPDTISYSGTEWTVTEIGQSAFAGKEIFRSVVIPDTVVVLRSSCFTDTYNLVSVTLPSSAVIERGAFSYPFGDLEFVYLTGSSQTLTLAPYAFSGVEDQITFKSARDGYVLTLYTDPEYTEKFLIGEYDKTQEAVIYIQWNKRLVVPEEENNRHYEMGDAFEPFDIVLNFDGGETQSVRVTENMVESFSTDEYIDPEAYFKTYATISYDGETVDFAYTVGYNTPPLTTNKYDLDGDGVKDEAYEISSESHLKWFAQQVNEGNGNINAVLMNDISLTTDHIPIGVREITGYLREKIYAYSGMFDGRGYTVRNLYIFFEDTYSPQGYSFDNGLFGYTDGARISNVTVEGPYIQAEIGAYGYSPCAGGLIGYAKNTVINNCHVTTGDNTLSRDWNSTHIITKAQPSLGTTVRAGILFGWIKDCTVMNCSVTKQATTDYIQAWPSSDEVSISYRKDYDEQAGGIAAYASDSTIVNCYVCSINSFYGVYSGNYGGLVGHAYDLTIRNCYSSGEIIGQVAKSYTYVIDNVFSGSDVNVFSNYDTQNGTTVGNGWYEAGLSDTATFTLREGQTAPYGQTTTLAALNWGASQIDGALAWEYGENGVTFVEPTVSSISIPAGYQNQTYAIGNDFKPFNIVVSYEQGGERTVEVTADMVTGLLTDALTETQTATLTYGGKTATFTYTVIDGYVYKVEHYQENIEDDGYTLVSADTENLAGVGTTNAVAKTYEGFTAQSFEQQAIAEDGSTVVKIYYTRNVYTITYDLDGGTIEGETSFSGKYGEAFSPNKNTPVKSGYTFGGYALYGYEDGEWKLAALVAIQPEDFKDTATFDYYDMKVEALWAECQVESISIPTASQNQSYVVDGAFVPFNITVTYDNGETESVEVTEAMLTDFSTTSAVTNATATVTYTEGEVTKTATFTYSVTNGYAYTVKHYQENLENDGYTLVEADTQTLYGVGTTNAAALTYEGFTAKSFSQVTVNTDGSTVLEIYYDRNTYTIEVNLDGGTLSGANDITVKFGETYRLPSGTPTKAGYTFAGWKIYIDGEVYINASVGSSWLSVGIPMDKAPEDTIEARVTWNERKISDMQLNVTNTTYEVGDEFRPFNMTVVYDNGETETVQVTAEMLTDFSTATARDTLAATITYKGATKLMTYKVVEKTNTVSFNIGDGTGTAPQSLDATVGASVTLPSADGLTKTGYTFGGWSDGTNTYEAGASYTPSDDVSLTAVWKLKAPTLTSNVGDTLEFVYDSNARNVTITAEHELGNQVTYTYNWYKGNCNPILPPGAEQVWSLGDVIFEGQTYAFVNVSQCYDALYKERGLYYYIEVIATHGENTSKYVYTLYVNIEKGDQTITLSENEFIYSEGLTIDFADYVSGAGDGTLSYAVSAQSGVTFDFANGVVSNITKAGGTFTLTVTKTATDNYNAATETFTITLNKGVQTLSVSGTPSAPTWKQNFTVSVSGNKGALSYAITSGNATINSSGVITANGAGQVRYSVTAAATDLYEAKTQEFSVTFSKAAGNLAPDYATSKPTNLTICVGHTSDDITLPTGWRFQSKTTLGQVGSVTLTAVFTPSDTANYSVYIENFTIAVTNHTGGTAASCTTDQVCTECGEVLVEALGHDWDDATCDAPKTCSVCDETEGEALGHDWNDATCEAPQTCSVCGETEGNALGHTDVAPKDHICDNGCGKTDMGTHSDGSDSDHLCDYGCGEIADEGCYDTAVDGKCDECGADIDHECGGGTADCTNPAHCSICGQSYGTVLGHDMSDATCTEASKCQREGCNYTEGSALGHTGGTATCTEEKICTRCGLPYGGVIGHADADFNHTCDNGCGKTDMGTHSDGSDTNHLCDYGCNQVADEGCYDTNPLDGKCDECGLAVDHECIGGTADCTNPATCSICGQPYGNALGHDWDAATCDTPKTCSVCGETEGEALGHDWDDVTCNAPKTCSVCGETEGNALGHDWDDATCETPKTCSVCGETEGEALGHTDASPKDHICDNGCGKTDMGTHSDGTDSDHLCDYGCGVIADEGCYDTEVDGLCDECGADINHTCVDVNEKDHACDICSAPMGEHKDSATDTDHVCDYGCGATLEDCSGGNATCTAQAVCTICGQPYGELEAHDFAPATCDVPSTCRNCPETTGVALGHLDENTDHVCDRNCGVTNIGEHTDGDDDDHLCDYGCGQVADEGCYDTNPVDGNCDECGVAVDHQHTGGSATCTAQAVCMICGQPYGELANHSAETEWQKNETHHWHECTGCDGQELDKDTHNDGDNDGSCDACGYAMSVTPPPHTHVFGTDWVTDEGNHWKECECEEKNELGAHVDSDSNGACDTCGYAMGTMPPPHTHSHGSTWETDANEHWNECECGDKANKAAHVDSDSNGACDTCGYAMGTTPPSHTHAHGSTWVTDANEHWNECECGDKANKAAHVDDNGDNKCDTCDYAMPAHDPDTPPVDNPPNDDDGGLGAGAIVGIVTGSVAVAGVGGFALFWFVIKKKSFADLIAIFKKK